MGKKWSMSILIKHIPTKTNSSFRNSISAIWHSWGFTVTIWSLSPWNLKRHFAKSLLKKSMVGTRRKVRTAPRIRNDRANPYMLLLTIIYYLHYCRLSILDRTCGFTKKASSQSSQTKVTGASRNDRPGLERQFARAIATGGAWDVLGRCRRDPY